MSSQPHNLIHDPKHAGPEAVSTMGKPAHATTALRGVNRCTVRPANLIAHQGYAVLVTDTYGRIGSGIEGFYLHQTRFLSRLKTQIDGSEPRFVSANVVDHHFITAYHLAPSRAGSAAAPERENNDASESEVVQKGIELQVNAFTGDGLHVDLIVTNHALSKTCVTLLLDLAADFADFNEAMAGKRQQTGLVERSWTGREGGGLLQFRYKHPELDLATRLELRGGGDVIDQGSTLACCLMLKPGEPHLVSLDLLPLLLGKQYTPFYGRDGAFAGGTEAAALRRDWINGCQQIDAANPVVEFAWQRAVSDLASLQILEGALSEPFMIVGGIPSYTGLFGRDAYVTGLQTAMLTPATLRGALQVITPLNAEETNDELDAEPGKVLHQRQLGPLAQLGINPFLRYYGDQSTPGLFLLAAATDLAHTGDVAFFRSLKDKLLGTLSWMKHNVDAVGFYPYQTRSQHGVKNQSWKDSSEAVLYPDGRMVKSPIAMADIQGLYYAGQQALGLAFAHVGEHALSAELLAEADALKRRFNDAFWMPQERFFAIALDAEKQQVRTVASDPGACLAYGIVDDDKAEAVANRLLAEDMFSGWGIRTLSSLHPAYNPFAYHLGTVWPAFNAVAAYGLRRYGFDDKMFAVAEGLFAASQVFDLDRLPEVFGGHPRDARHPHPGVYPGACSPQAWSAGAVILLVNTMLGLMPLAPRHTLVVDPALPDWLPEIVVKNIQVGTSRAALRVWRDATGLTEVEVLDSGGLLIIRPNHSASPSGHDRVAARFQLALHPLMEGVLAGRPERHDSGS